MSKTWCETIAKILLVAAVIGTAIGAVALQTQQAHAYTYLTTNTASIFNRGWISASSSGYLELIGADPIGPRLYMPSWQNPGGEYSYIHDYQNAIWSDKGGQDDLVWYSLGNGSWTRGGANMGTGDLTGNKNGTGFGCIATYGYGWGGNVLSKHGGLDALIHNHIYITAIGDTGTVTKREYGEIDFWPRVKIQYNANGGINAPGAHYKYIGSTANISTAKPTRTGYTFEGWSTQKSGPVNIASGQKVGYQDWNLQRASNIGHNWSNGGPSDFWRDTGAGQPSPTGSNTITLYAQWKPISYTIAYNGNGATSGSTASSSHVYDAAKALTTNGFNRSYTLACKTQGGSAGDKNLACVWGWKNWNAAANGSGASFTNKASVKNIRSSVGTTTLYAQWNPGSVTLPDPGTRAGYRFTGWYSTSNGGTLMGQPGTSVSIGKNTTCYAQWQQLTIVNYYVDGSSTPIFTETVDAGVAYNANPTATQKGIKPNCSGFDGWYASSSYSNKYVDGTLASGFSLSLYGRNSVSLEYATTDRSSLLDPNYEFFADENKTVPASAETLYPALKSYWYGDSVTFPKGIKAYYEDASIPRELTSGGVYSNRAATGSPRESAVLTSNTVAYVDWPWTVYDGVVAGW